MARKKKVSLTEMTVLEREFHQVAIAINEKILQAAVLIEEANKIGQKANLPNIRGYNEYRDYQPDKSKQDQEADDLLYKIKDNISFSPLFEQLDAAGWRTSNIEC